MRRVLFAALAQCALAGAAARADGAPTAPGREYVVLYEHGASGKAARAAITDAGGKCRQRERRHRRRHRPLQRRLVRGRRRPSRAIVGATTNRAIGQGAERAAKVERDKIEKDVGSHPRLGRQGPRRRGRRPARRRAVGHADDPRDAGRLLRRQQGSHAVRVGIIDTGIDGRHPDIAPNFDARLSRNFTVDDPSIDGACDTDPDDSARTRPTSTRTATARTWRRRSARRSTASASPASRRRSSSSTSAPARTRATSSSARRSTR